MKLFNYQVIQLFLYKMDDEWQKYLVTYKYLVVLSRSNEIIKNVHHFIIVLFFCKRLHT
jgi:hypothetical protein